MLARWLLVRPPIFIVDEPTRGIDIGAKMEVHQLLRELAREGAAIILISSELPEVLSLAERILVMREGCLAGEIPRGEATEESILRLATLPHPVLSENSRFAVDFRESGCIVHGSCPQPRQKPWPNSTQDPIIGQ
jgi:ABC-type multidrug transport system ATPase subunit